jgi:hypothetical protein
VHNILLGTQMANCFHLNAKISDYIDIHLSNFKIFREHFLKKIVSLFH